jgi:2-C-methyl-D-erythritol 4-phosphate cytidylyltransferase
MVTALIIAGGVGERTGNKVPKQFLNVFDKPIIIYTLEAFQRHREIDEITVVCLDGWHEFLKTYCMQFGISKIVSVVSGGKNGQESIYLGLCDIKARRAGDDFVLIHEANRPLVSEAVISDSIRVSRQFSGAVAAVPCNDAMLERGEAGVARSHIPRERLVKAQNPHTFRLDKLLWAHEQAKTRGITNSVATSTLMADLGEPLHLSLGAEMNFKITTGEDIEIFKAILRSR